MKIRHFSAILLAGGTLFFTLDQSSGAAASAEAPSNHPGHPEQKGEPEKHRHKHPEPGKETLTPPQKSAAVKPADKKEEAKKPAEKQEAPQAVKSTTPAANTPPPSPELQRIKSEIELITAQKDRLKAELDLEQTRREKELAKRRREVEERKLLIEETTSRLDLAEAQRKAGLSEKTRELRQKAEVAAVERALAESEAEVVAAGVKKRTAAEMEKIAKLKSDRELQTATAEARSFTERAPVYMANPLKDRTLTVSDRRIPLNGPITMRTADTITTRIDYFNNKDSKAPIFIVIDDSPGGSVMAGYRILKSMEGSEAPVHVVVKSFAASMAAVITTLAEESYAYPNAVILHHQISSGMAGNLTEQKEQVVVLEEWFRRLAGPMAEKMGTDLDSFVKEMYSKNSTGDWEEFADKAVDLKWVNHIVDEIRETAQTVHPDQIKAETPAIVNPRSAGVDESEGDPENGVSSEKMDERGQRYRVLPRLNPRDGWWMHNPDRYYRYN